MIPQSQLKKVYQEEKKKLVVKILLIGADR